MKILAIYTYGYYNLRKDLSKPLNDFRCIQIGFSAVVTNMLKKGHSVNLEVYTQYTNIKKATREILKDEYDLVCVTSVTAHIQIVKSIIREIKQIKPNIKILIGGPHATLFPEDVIKDKNFDALCIGEGFETINLYLDYLEGKRKADEVTGFWIREKGRVVKNEQSAFSDFSKFPIIERSLWDKWVDNTDIQSVLISRGCPNSCSFCANHVLRRKNSGQYVEFRNIDDIMKEIITIRKKYPEVHTVFLETETFSIDLKYTYRLLDKLKKYNSKLKNKLKVYTNLLFNNSVKNDMENFAVKLKEANLVQICMGLESGSEIIRRNILHRPHYTNDDFITFCRYMQKQGVFVALNVMVGLPTETAEDLDMTIAVVDEISPAIVMPTIFTSYPGTDIYDLMLKNKIIKNSKFITGWDERRKARLGSDKMTKKVIQEKFQYLLDKYENVDKRRIQTAKLLRANKNN